ncbi:MAG: hypothetical protein WD431_11315 [Cyclobacteriaceae bacterium]
MGLSDIVQSIKEKILKEIKVLKGKNAKDKIYYSKNEFKTLQDTKEAFNRSKTKLFDVNKWSEMPGITSTFELYDGNGLGKSGKPIETGDYILINLPGPLPDNWVKVTSMVDQEEMAEFVVGPSEKPINQTDDKEKVEHFFSEEATSTFRIKRVGTILYAYEIGKDETINNEWDETGDREWINTLMTGGGWLGFQKVQWKNLTDYLVHRTEIE